MLSICCALDLFSPSCSAIGYKCLKIKVIHVNGVQKFLSLLGYPCSGGSSLWSFCFLIVFFAGLFCWLFWLESEKVTNVNADIYFHYIGLIWLNCRSTGRTGMKVHQFLNKMRNVSNCNPGGGMTGHAHGQRSKQCASSQQVRFCWSVPICSSVHDFTMITVWLLDWIVVQFKQLKDN